MVSHSHPLQMVNDATLINGFVAQIRSRVLSGKHDLKINPKVWLQNHLLRSQKKKNIKVISQMDKSPFQDLRVYLTDSKCRISKNFKGSFLLQPNEKSKVEKGLSQQYLWLWLLSDGVNSNKINRKSITFIIVLMETLPVISYGNERMIQRSDPRATDNHSQTVTLRTNQRTGNIHLTELQNSCGPVIDLCLLSSHF